MKIIKALNELKELKEMKFIKSMKSINVVNKNTIWKYIKSYKFNSLIIRYFIIISLIIILPFSIISYFNISNTKQIIRNEIEASNISETYRLRAVIDNIIKQVDLLATNTSLHDNVRMFMYSSSYNSIFDDDYYKIKDFISVNSIVFNYVDSIYVYSERNKAVVTKTQKMLLKDFEDVGWHEAYNQKKDNYVEVIARKKGDSYKYCITLIKPVIIEMGEKLGSVVVDINSKDLNRFIRTNNNVSEAHKVYLVDDKGIIMHSYNIEQVGTSANKIDYLRSILESPSGTSNQFEIDGMPYVSTTVDSMNYQFRYVYLMPLANYQERVNQITMFNINVIIFCVFLCFVLAMFVSLKVYRPIREIISVIDNPEKIKDLEMKNSEKDNKNIAIKNDNENIYETINNNGSDELRYIMKNIMQTIKDNEEIKDELRQRLALLNKAHYSMLQAQVNPHFLYNTLETINWMAVDFTNSDNNVSAAIQSLSRLLRANNEAEDFMINFSDEINYAKLYIEILKLRYDDIFIDVWDIEDEILKCKTIKLCLQPLIENAVYHGIKPKKSFGTIKIIGRIADDIVVIEIIDDGVGMEQEELDKLNYKLEEKYDFTGKHIGITNVNQRIKIICGEQYGITVTSTKNVGTTVRLAIPVIKI